MAVSEELERIQAAYRERDAAAPVTSPWTQRPYRRLMQQLEWELLDGLAACGTELAGARVAEVGCGAGYFLSRFLDYGAAEAAGIDLMEHRIALGRERDPRLSLVAGDAARLPWADGSFDVVTQFTCLSAVHDDDLRRRIAAEMWRVLRPGGALVSYDMRTTPPAVRALRRAAARRRGTAAGRTETRPLDAGELRALFPQADLAIRVVTFAPDLAAAAERAPGLPALLATLPPLRTHLLATARRG